MSNGDSDIRSRTLTNTGQLLSRGRDASWRKYADKQRGSFRAIRFPLHSPGITNSGTLTGLNGLHAHSTTASVLDNTASGKILTQGLLTLSGKTLSNYSGN
ncbi:hypothetical protein CWS02_19360 [Enterobacter sp. EA-1]|nr:hypothetical protein CWS02_19360 [Enterobacter sp. EA-1]